MSVCLSACVHYYSHSLAWLTLVNLRALPVVACLLTPNHLRLDCICCWCFALLMLRDFCRRLGFVAAALAAHVCLCCATSLSQMKSQAAQVSALDWCVSTLAAAEEANEKKACKRLGLEMLRYRYFYLCQHTHRVTGLALAAEKKAKVQIETTLHALQSLGRSRMRTRAPHCAWLGARFSLSFFPLSLSLFLSMLASHTHKLSLCSSLTLLTPSGFNFSKLHWNSFAAAKIFAQSPIINLFVRVNVAKRFGFSPLEATQVL